MYDQWDQWGDDIKRSVQDAVDSRDFSRLNQTVTNTINQAVDNLNTGLRNGGWYRTTQQNTGANAYRGTNGAQQGAGGYAGAGQGQWQNQSQNRNGAGYTGNTRMPNPRFKRVTLRRVVGVLLAVFGALYAVLFVLAFLSTLAEGILFAGGFVYALGMIPWYLVLILGSVGAAFAGWRMFTFAGRFQKYTAVIGNRELCNISELARRTGFKEKSVKKDLNKMLTKGWFLQGYLDDTGSCLLVTDRAYREYRSLMDSRKRQEEEERAAGKEQEQKERASQEEFGRLSPEVQKIIREGENYVRRIHEANDAIPGEEISEKIARMEMLVDKIFDRVEKNPELVGDIRKLMDYYLPTTMKLLDAYVELDRADVPGGNAAASKREIEDTLDTLNTAFEKLLDGLFRDAAWDVSSDISVLNAMLAQEGLKEDGLTGRKKG